MFRKLFRNKPAVLFGLLLFYLYFRGIGDHGLIEPVEGINASVELHMSAGGNYFVPKIGESLSAGSTMGTWWLSAIALKVFGWSEFAVRFWSALSGLGMVLAASISARQNNNEPARKSWLSACISASMMLCFIVSQLASSHSVYSCLMAFTMAGVIRSRENKRWLILSHISAVSAFIAQGPEGLFIPFLAVIIYCVISEDWGTLKDFFTWPSGIIITISVSGLYFILLVITNPEIIHFMRCQTHTYTFGGILGMMVFAFMSFAPFHGFIIRAVYEVFPRSYPAEKSPEVFMLIWSMVFIIFAVLTGDILMMSPCVPALSAIVGGRLDSWLEQKKLYSVRASVMMNILVLVPVMYMILPFTVRHFPILQASMMSLIPYGILTGLFIFATWYYTKTRQITKWVRNVSGAALLCLMPIAGVFNLTADMYSIRDIGLKLRDTIQGNDKVIQYGVNYPSVYFYTLRNYSIIDAELTPGVAEKKFIVPDTVIGTLWSMRERVFLIIPNEKTTEKSLPKNIFHILEAEGMLLLSNQ